MAKKLGTCPECGSDTVVERDVCMGITYLIERCDGLIEVEEGKPLEACKWEQELKMISNGIVKER